MNTILITGGCGFVGANLAINFKNDNPNSKIICLDNLKRRGSELNISRLKQNNIEFIHGDIRNKEDLDLLPHIDIIIDAAAEPSVLAGIDSTPDYLINTNLIGTVNCLNLAVKHKSVFVLLSTSRVYPIKTLNLIPLKDSKTRFEINQQKNNIIGVSQKGINEEFSLNGSRSLYGSSKLSAELLVEEYAAFYGLRTIINRCGVLTGPWQMGKIDQGVVVLWLAMHFWKKELGYFGFGGEGKQVRDMLHVQDLYKLLAIQLNDVDKFSGFSWNVGGGNDVSVSLFELTELCQEITANKIKINKINENRVADIPWYITDNSKISKLSGWKPTISKEKILIETFEWMKDNENILKNILS
jgi:CDP-paratose 2-epimerase